MKKYFSIIFLCSNFLLNLSAVRHINNSFENAADLVDIYVILGLVHAFQLGIPLSFSVEIARNSAISEKMYRLSSWLWVVMALVLTTYIYNQAPNTLFLVPVFLMVMSVNNYRGVMEGFGRFYTSHLLKLVTSGVLFWLIIFSMENIGIFIFVGISMFANIILICAIKRNVKDPSSKIGERSFLPSLIQSIFVISMLYIDRLVLRSNATAGEYINFTLMQEAIYRPIGFVTIFASYHFHQLNSANNKIFRSGLNNYFFHLLFALILLFVVFLTDAHELYFKSLGFAGITGNFSLLAVWFLLILTVYLQRLILSARFSQHSLLIFAVTCLSSVIFGACTTVYFSNAVYSLLAHCIVECCAMLVYLYYHSRKSFH